MTPGTLFLIPVALGETDWESVLPAPTRATACRLQHFVVENAKSARAELKRMQHPTPLRELSIVELPRDPAPHLASLLAPLHQGHDLGLMSEAGCPAVADPGALLVRAAHESAIPVAPLVGPSSILLALMASGLNGQSFSFHGYLPVEETARTQRLQALERESRQQQRTQIFIETPYRNPRMLEAIRQHCTPDTLLCVAEGLTTTAQRIRSQPVRAWQHEELPNRTPAIFLILAARH